MKPRIKKQTHYNLLLMKDDSPARTFRLHGTVLKFLIILFVVILLAGVSVSAGGVHFFQEYMLLVSRNETQEKELSEIRLRLERLVNLECLIAANNGTVPLAKNEEIGVSRLPARSTPEGSAEGQDATGQTASHTGSQPDNGAAPATGTPEGGQAAAATPEDQATSQPAGQTAGQNGEQSDGSAHTPAAAADGLPSLDAQDSPLRINSFNARIIGRERLRITYELANALPDKQRTVSGSVRYRALLTDGNSVDLRSYDGESMRFVIARMKPMQNSVRMPQGYLTENVDKIEILVELSDGTVYQDRFSLDK